MTTEPNRFDSRAESPKSRINQPESVLDLRDANPVTKVDRVRGDDDESRAGGVAALAIGEMQLFYNKDRLTTVGELVEAITGAHVSMKELRRIAAIKLP